MDYEKKYKEAQKWIESIYSELSHEQQMEAEAFIPELKRKVIYGWIYTQPSQFFDNGFSKEEMLAWLEKQGEQNTTNKVEPKFHKGKWIVWQDKCYKVNYNGCGYELIDQNGLSTSLEYGTVDKSAHLWTIQDAKDGDVLVCTDDGYNSYILFGEKNIHCWYNGQTEHFHPTTSCKLRKDATIYPATKEQRDLLFQKMKEAGYEWDSDKKELKLLISNGGDFDSKNCEQKSAWSNKEKMMLDDIIEATERSNIFMEDYQRELVTWLKSLKQRIGG